MSSSSHAGGLLDDDAAWRECASYEERFIRPAVLEFQPSGIRLELEQSGGDSSGFDFDQVTVWPAGVVMARALQHPAMAISIAGRRVLELGFSPFSEKVKSFSEKVKSFSEKVKSENAYIMI